MNLKMIEPEHVKLFSFRLAAGMLLLLVVSICRFASGEEPAAQVPKEIPIVDGAKTDAEVPKPNDAEGKPAGDEGKDKPAEAKPAKKERAKRPRAANAAGLDAVAAPLRALFGGPAAIGAPVFAPAQEVPKDVEDNDPMTLQFLQQFRPILTGELAYVRLVCSDLTPAQRPKIKAAALTGLKQVAKQMANQQNRAQRGIATAQVNAEPGKAIREGIAKAMKETLNEEQMVRYTAEANQRTIDRKKASILSVVSRLDGQLFLTAEQRDKIENGISERWQDSWEKWLLMASAYGDRYFPQIPEQCVAPHLTAEQKSVWNGLQKVDFGWWWGGQNGIDPDNDGWWGPDDPEANVNNGFGVLIDEKEE